MNLFPDTFIRWRGTKTTDRYGNVVIEWNDDGKTPISGVSVQPDYQRTDLVGGGDRVVVDTGLKVISRPGLDIDLLSTDRILHGELDGSAMNLWYVMDGEVARFSLGGGVHHVEARLKRWLGG